MRLPTLVVLLFAAACAGAKEGPAVVHTDSAGIEIVTNLRPAWTAEDAWRVDTTPQLTIGVADGELPYLFARVSGATRLADGRIVVADEQANEIRFFDPRGSFLFKVGRTGQGPGEYQLIRALKRCAGDSITAFDLHWGLKVYDQNGGLHQELALTAEPGSNRTPYALDCSRAGVFLVTGWGSELSAGALPIGLYRTTAPLLLLSRDGSLLKALGTYPGSERLGHERGSRPHPFGRVTVLAAGEDQLFVGTGDSYELSVLSLDGDTVRLIRAADQDRRITPELLKGYRDAVLAAAPADRRPALERQMRDMPLPERYPPYTELRRDAGGHLWLRRFALPGAAEQTWTVFDSTGRELGPITLPAALTMLEIGADYLLAVRRDDLGVERVELLALRKAS